MRKGVGVFLVVLAVIVVAVFFLFEFSPIPQQSAFQLDLGQMRAMAQEQSGPLPIGVEKLVFARGSFPQAFVITGGGLNSQPMVMAAYSPLPGIVLIKAPGHSPGGQIVYVKTQDGQEYLITGDIAWSMQALQTRRNRPLLLSLALRENRDQVANQIQALYQLSKDTHIHILVTHDPDQ